MSYAYAAISIITTLLHYAFNSVINSIIGLFWAYDVADFGKYQIYSPQHLHNSAVTSMSSNTQSRTGNSNIIAQKNQSYCLTAPNIVCTSCTIL